MASFLTLRDTCMLASTCRALWAMDLLWVKLLQREQITPGGATSVPHCNCSAQPVIKDNMVQKVPSVCRACVGGQALELCPTASDRYFARQCEGALTGPGV